MDKKKFKNALAQVDFEATVEKYREIITKQNKSDDELLADQRLVELTALILADSENPLTILLILHLALEMGKQPIPEDCLPDVELPKSLFDECSECPEEEQ